LSSTFAGRAAGDWQRWASEDCLKQLEGIMTSSWRNGRNRVLSIALSLSALAFAGLFSENQRNSARAQTRATAVAPDEATKARLQKIVKGILAAWDKADVVCLGEDHGGKNDSDLRITLVEHPDFVHKVNVIIVESANAAHQDILDRFILDGEELPREKLRVVWSDADGAEVWESPIYEAFLRAVRKANLAVPRQQRVRLIGGDDPSVSNRGKYIREAVSREILSKGLKGLAIYGAGHCVCHGGGFPGELADKYPGKIWAVFGFFSDEGVQEGRRIFGLGDEPTLIPVTGTDKAKLPAGRMFFLGTYNQSAALGDVVNEIVYYGNIKDAKVYPDKR
jgi:hypothetical protein